MANSSRIYWDACVWIALIQQEVIRDAKGVVIEDRHRMCRTVISAASKDQVEIATATLSYAEVVGRPESRSQGEEKIAQYFEVDYIFVINVDRAVAERARTLMMAGYSKLKPVDACHLAAAVISNCDEMHTFDDKLLVLDGRIDKADGTKLKICKPAMSSPAPLIKVMESEPKQAGLFDPPPLPPTQARQIDIDAPAPVAPPLPPKGRELDLDPPPQTAKEQAIADGPKDEPRPEPAPPEGQSPSEPARSKPV